jgi:4'-phosphopantetheinyl transferase
VEPRSDAFVHDWFTPAERALVEHAAPTDRLVVTSLVWSAKESALKALREGLRLDTRDVVVSPGDQMADGWTGVQVEYTNEGLRMPGSWRLHAGHVLTIVAHPHPDSLRCILATPSAN